jgi:transposase
MKAIVFDRIGPPLEVLQLAAYAGLTPAEFRSGYFLYGKTHLSKIGNAFLRKALYLPAAVARRWSTPFKPWVRILESRKLHHLAIRGAIMRKLLHIAFGVLKHQKPFNPLLVSFAKTLCQPRPYLPKGSP